MTKDLFAKPEPEGDAAEPFTFTKNERLAICDKISDFATKLVDNAEHPNPLEVTQLVKEIEDIIAQEVDQA
jgi:hypothetical protein